MQPRQAPKPYHKCAKPSESGISIIIATKASFIDITPAVFRTMYWMFSRPTWNTHPKPSYLGLRNFNFLEDAQQRSI